MKSVEASLAENNERCRLLSQKGQAAVEYVLILVVGVMLVGMLRVVYKPFGDFMQVYFTGYLQCLLETGELPGQQGGVCQDEYDAARGKFSSQSKAGLNSVGGANDKAAGKGGKNGKGNANGADAQAKAKSEAKNQAQARAPVAKRGSSASRGENGSSSSNSGRSRLAGNTNGRGRKEGPVEQAYTGSSAVSSGSARGGSPGRPRVQALDGHFRVIDDTPKSSTSTRTAANGNKGDESSMALRPKKTLDTYSPRKPASQSEETSFSVGFAFRFILIAAIIIMIVFVVGGQLLQISQGSE